MKVNKILRIPRFFRSVFTRLLFISLVTWFLIVVSLIITLIMSRHERKAPFYRNADQYTQYILDDIGSPPVKAEAERLSQEAGIHISYKGNDVQWSTRDDFPDVADLRFRTLPGSKKLKYGRASMHRFLYMSTADGGEIFFEFSGTEEEKEELNKSFWIFFFFLSLILLGSYYSIKRVLKPLKWVDTGVQQVKVGNFNHTVPIRGDDEFTDMAMSFNEMTEKLRLLITNKENLLRDVSHELRSPLTRIRVALAMLDKTEEKKAIEADIEEMEAMITALLETARHHHDLDQNQFTKQDMHELTRSICKRYETTGAGVVFSCDHGALYTYIDTRSMQTVLSNCIENGIKYSHEKSEPVKVTLHKDSDRITLSISDNGCGIGEEELSYIFEPFYRIDPSRSRKTGGYGLGLSICKKIIESHGGTIEAKSKKGVGTTILIQLERYT